VHAVAIDLNHDSGHRIAPLIQHGGAPLKDKTGNQNQSG
jgi:hypothetical protein